MTHETQSLGEVLRQARDAKEVDLPRVERETKIRLRYLTALENGDYRDLPGPVYVRGFLRNYGHYLDLDPEYLIGLYRAEAGPSVEERTVTAPGPVAMRRPRTFVITPGAVVTVVLTLFVAVFLAYLGYQFLTFARTPELVVTDPEGNLSSEGFTEYTIRGRTEPNSRIEVEALGGNPEGMADDDGEFEVTVNLVPGVNVITVTASDPRTGRDSEPVQRTITVGTAARPSTQPTAAPQLVVSEPADGATLEGPVVVSGDADATAVTLSATLVEAAPMSFQVSDSTGARIEPPEEPATPDALEIPVEDGRYTGELRLPPGTWELAVAVADAPAETRTVTITAPETLSARVEVRGGASWLELYEDGVLETAASLRNAPDGANIDLSARRTIRIRAGSAGAVTIFVNGISLGSMGDVGEVVDWTVTAGS